MPPPPHTFLDHLRTLRLFYTDCAGADNINSTKEKSEDNMTRATLLYYTKHLESQSLLNISIEDENK